MKSVYERTNLIITEFHTEDVIATSGPAPTPTPTDPVAEAYEKENAYSAFSSFRGDAPGSWF